MNIAHVDYSPATRSLDIFFSGCNPPYCEECCNPELIDFEGGTPWEDWWEKIEKYCHEYKELIDNIFLLGGSPNHQDNTEMNEFLGLIFLLCQQNIWLFAREELDYIKPVFKHYCSYIKCGAYIPGLKCDDREFYGVKLATSNQKIYKKGIDYD